jgi:hypothetical protein
MRHLVAVVLILSILSFGCCGGGQNLVNASSQLSNYSETAIKQTVVGCNPGMQMTLTKPAGNVSGVPISVKKSFVFKGLQNGSCTLEAADGTTCSYTQGEVENLNAWEIINFLNERCMGGAR